MKVVLKRDVKGLGKADEVKKVAEGYARNYLFPRGLAAPATEMALQGAEQRQRTAAAQEAQRRAHSEVLAARIKEHALHFTVKAGEAGRLYGSITSKDVAEAISKILQETLDKRLLGMEQPIRELGVHLVDLKLPGGVVAQARVVVEAEA